MRGQASAAWRRRLPGVHTARAVVRHPRLLLATRVAIGAGVVLRFGLALRSSLPPELFEFGTLATNLVAGRGYSVFAQIGREVLVGTTGRPVPGAFMPPAYTYVVAGSMEVAASSNIALGTVLGIVQAIFGCGTVALSHRIARDLGGRTAAAVAAAAVSLWPPLVLLPTLGSAANLYLPLLLGLALVLLRVAAGPRLLHLAPLTAITTLLWLARAEAPLFLVAGVAAAAVASQRRRQVVLVGVASLLCAFASVTVLWLAPRSHAMGAQLTTVATTGWFNAWFGNAEGATGSQKAPPLLGDELVQKLVALRPSPRYELDREALFKDDLLADVRRDVPAFLLRIPKKSAMAVAFDPYDQRAGTVALGVASTSLTGAVITLLWAARRARKLGARHLVPLSIGASQIALCTVFFALNRYKTTVDLSLLIVGAVVACALLADDSDTEAATSGTQ